ncbi:hypothetical protein BV511_04075 [Methylorubrum extorquens]|jgi:hypothetical protein|uniref:hypothetical protein n=1 Tax=Methylorubrum extorquens TaxID=408 RepID=UPI0009728861|nr:MULTISPECIES: hypothetical protein [Methylorubrum]APX83967.1 hypothetical protein BV511_04075 [Methylorubrum extorquens]ARO54544.1 hypothetical protein B2G69_10510 [Methylorubrum zatmanii]
MLTSVAYFLASTLILQPVQAEVADRLRKAKVAPEVVAQAQSCMSSALPTLVQRVGDDYWWAVTTAAGVWLGLTPLERVVAEVAPSCRGTVDMIRAS